MLTADLVRVRRRGDQLTVRPLQGATRADALQLAQAYLQLAADHVGQTLEELEAEFSEVEVHVRQRRLGDGLRKLVLDRCELAMAPGEPPADLRREVFSRAAEQRRDLASGESFERALVLEEVAELHGLTAGELEQRLFADLKGAQVLLSAPVMAAEALVREYDLAQAQAVLLRAVRVVALVQGAPAGAYRALFNKLKFLRLLYTIQPLPDEGGGGYRIEIDGPYSLFSSVTRYGLQLALLLPALAACGRWQLDAEVLWGRERQRMRAKLEPSSISAKADAAPPEPPARLPDEVRALLDGLRRHETPWQAEPAGTLLHLPGVGVIAPDLVFRHREGGKPIYMEVLGYWSRDAVWRRIDLVRGGLVEPILFAVSSRLRVSEAALDDDLPAALYVYKGVIQARQVLRRLDELAAR